MYLATVAWATSIPSLSSSPWIRGAPQSGLAKLIMRVNSRTSSSIAGLPGSPCRVFHRQYQRTLFDARRSPFRALRSAAPSANATRGGRAQPRAVGPRSSDEAGRAATSSGPLAGGGELESQPAGLREIEATIGC